MNPMEIMQVFNQLKSNPNPMVLMQQMYGNNPMFQQALNMAKGKSPVELQQTLINLAQTKGINPEVLNNFMSQFGFKI